MCVLTARAGVQATYLSASDVVAALTALLEQPLSVRDDATPRDRFWCVYTPLQLHVVKARVAVDVHLPLSAQELQLEIGAS